MKFWRTGAIVFLYESTGESNSEKSKTLCVGIFQTIGQIGVCIVLAALIYLLNL